MPDKIWTRDQHDLERRFKAVFPGDVVCVETTPDTRGDFGFAYRVQINGEIVIDYATSLDYVLAWLKGATYARLEEGNIEGEYNPAVELER